MRASEVASAMGIPLRSYEHLESGRGRITYERLVKFATVTNSDPVALLAAVPLKSARFPLRCADNKLMTILMISIAELEEELGDDIAFIEVATLISAFTRTTKDLIEHVQKRDLFAERWLEENGRKVQAEVSLPQPAWRRRTT